MNRSVANEEELQALLHETPALLLYFSSPGCGVCEVLKPRVSALLAEKFPRIVAAEVDCTKAAALCAQHQIFSVPALLLFLEGRESLRLVRNFHLNEVRDLLARPYTLLFGGDS